jgi:hypothetical protein
MGNPAAESQQSMPFSYGKSRRSKEYTAFWKDSSGAILQWLKE